MTTLARPDRQTAAELAPIIRAHAARAEAERAMAPEVMEALRAAGIFQMWTPAALGGAEMEPNAALEVMEELARIDPATGWVVSNSVFITMLYQFLPESTYRELLGDRDAIVAGSFVPPGLAREVDGGYRVSGNWTFGSASQRATSLVTLNLLADENGPILGEDGSPTSVVAFLDPADVTFLDTWHTLGLRGTGSTNFTLEDHFVAEDHTFRLGPWENPPGPFSGPLYRIGLIIDATRIAQVAVGIAQGALDEFLELAGSKVPAYTASVTADRATVQERVARAQALIQAGRHTLRATIADAFAAVQDGPRITGDACIPAGLAATFALTSAAEAVDLLYEAAGSTGFRDESPIQKRFRDIQTIRQNAITSWSRYESLGKMILGRPSDWPFHQL